MIIVLIVLYAAFIGLGASDSLLGTAWPSMNAEYLVPLSYAGAASVIVATGKVIACLTSDRLCRKFGEAMVIGASTVAMAVGLFGIFSIHSFWALLFFSIPLGFGSGYVDVTICSYTAVHYDSRFNNWLQCMWSVGASIGPVIMGRAIAGKNGWSFGYFSVGLILTIVTLNIFLSRKNWLRHVEVEVDGKMVQIEHKHLSLKEIITLPGVVAVMLCFLFYNGLQETASLWTGSYMTIHKGLSADIAATAVSSLFIGITIARFISGFLSMKFSDTQMVRIGSGAVLLGIVFLFLLPGIGCAAGLILIGVGCAPVYPCMLHMTADVFGPEHAPAILDAEMAFAFAGSTLFPPLFGMIADRKSVV